MTSIVFLDIYWWKDRFIPVWNRLYTVLCKDVISQQQTALFQNVKQNEYCPSHPSSSVWASASECFIAQASASDVLSVTHYTWCTTTFLVSQSSHKCCAQLRWLIIKYNQNFTPLRPQALNPPLILYRFSGTVAPISLPMTPMLESYLLL